jgi:hypothetical protein
MSASNMDLMALLVNAMTGDRTGIPILVDAVKEAGHEAAAGNLALLLNLRQEVLTALGNSRLMRRHLAACTDPDDVEAEESRLVEEGGIGAYENVLRWLGEEAPPEPPGNTGCEGCGLADATGPDGLCDGCRGTPALGGG